MSQHQEPRVYNKADLTYNSYLKVSELLDLQQCKSEPVHHDEMLFIVIHQAYELWFKLILGELENAMQYMAEGKVLRALHFLRRVVEIQKLLVNQIHILETMTPIEFLGFRDHLNPASGFQSFQFREIEFIAGLKNPAYFQHFEDQRGMDNLKARADGPDLWESFQSLLKRLHFDVPDQTVRPETPAGSDRDRVMQALVTIYQNPEMNMEIYMLAEELVDFDTQLALWRYHHVSVVERVIGFKKGTGGSSGAAYLRSTIQKKCFPMLWEVRTQLGSFGYGRSPFGSMPHGGEDAPAPDEEPPTTSAGCPFGHS